MKFGGTSMAGTERIRRVAQIVRKQAAAGDQVAVVVSAMAGETDRLVNFCREANALYDPAEYDVVVASGEQVTSGLLALTLQSLGAKARSWMGWQLPVRTMEAHAKAKVDRIDAPALTAALEAGEIAVIPGFQGVSDAGRITTMGRGGSDTSAVAVAAAIQADRCDIYTDVDGVYTTDPRIVAKARKLKAGSSNRRADSTSAASPRSATSSSVRRTAAVCSSSRNRSRASSRNSATSASSVRQSSASRRCSTGKVLLTPHPTPAAAAWGGVALNLSPRDRP